MILLAMVTLCCSVIAGVSAMVEPAPVQASDRLVAARAEIEVAAPSSTPVRVVGAPFAPNVNPRAR